MPPERYDCPPTLTDRQVIDFCKNGFLMLEGVVPEETNRRTLAYVTAADTHWEPTSLIDQPWFVKGVLKNPAAAGAVRALLGRDFALPILISNHRGALPAPTSQNWHRDGGSIDTHKLEYLQVFYYPQECTPEMGPTEVLPGSHFLRSKAPLMAHYGTILGSVVTTAPAGSIFLTVYSIWHRRRRAPATGETRHLLKYNYWRTTPPRRDWILDPGLDFSAVDFNPPIGAFEQFQGGIAAARMFCWLCEIEEQYEHRGGQCWPVVPTLLHGDEQMGLPDALRKG